MIWATAKSTDVNSRQRPWPSRASGFVGARPGPRGRRRGVAMTGLLRRRRRAAVDARRGDAASRRERSREIVLQVLEVLEADRHAQQARRDARRRPAPLRSSGAARSTADGRPSCGRCRARRSARSGVSASMTARPAVAPAGHLDREHPADDAGAELARGDVVLGMAREAGIEDACARRPDAPARRRVPPRSGRGAPTRTARVRIPRRTRKASNGPIVAPVSIWTFSTRRTRSRATGHDAGDDVAVAGQELRRRFDDEVGPELERPADVRRGERVVDEVRRAGSWARRASAAWSATTVVGIGDRLGVDDAASARRRCAAVDGRRVGQVDEVDVDPEPRERVESCVRVEPYAPRRRRSGRRPRAARRARRGSRPSRRRGRRRARRRRAPHRRPRARCASGWRCAT